MKAISENIFDVRYVSLKPPSVQWKLSLSQYQLYRSIFQAFSRGAYVLARNEPATWAQINFS